VHPASRLWIGAQEGLDAARGAEWFVSTQPAELLNDLLATPEAEVATWPGRFAEATPAMRDWARWAMAREGGAWWRELVTALHTLLDGAKAAPAPLLPTADVPPGTELSVTSRVGIHQLRRLPPPAAAEWVMARLPGAVVERLVTLTDAELPAALRAVATERPDLAGLVAFVAANAEWFTATVAEVRRLVAAAGNGQAQPAPAPSAS
jgi:hypothetical protein